MCLAQALILRADYQKRVEQLKQRILNNAKVQEGDTPSQDPQALRSELERLAGDLVSLIQRINQTNAQTQRDDFCGASYLNTAYTDSSRSC